MLRIYRDGDRPLAVIEAGEFKFYVYGSEADSLSPGACVEFEGKVHLDHYIWVEFLANYPDPPNLFYNLRVIRIRRVRIPERFIHRQANGMSYPSTVDDDAWEECEELETMQGQEFRAEFFLIDFNSEGSEGVDVRRTFQ